MIFKNMNFLIWEKKRHLGVENNPLTWAGPAGLAAGRSLGWVVGVQVQVVRRVFWGLNQTGLVVDSL